MKGGRRAALTTLTQAGVTCRGLDPGEEASYLEFAAEAWGKHSPQADSLFLRWLYDCNPNTLGMNRDLLVLLNGEQIVGAHHRMRVPWRINSRRLVIPSLHDLYVLPSHRSAQGQKGLLSPGLRLMLAAFEGETHVSLFGMSAEAEAVYRTMRMPSLQLFWLQKLRSRFTAGFQMAASRFRWQFRSPVISRRQNMRLGYHISCSPLPTDDELTEALILKPQAQTYPDWDLGSYKWRFFHELGPSNILLVARQNGTVMGRCVVSVGLRRGCIVGRIVELLAEDSTSMKALLQESEVLFAHLKVSVCLTATSSEEVSETLLTLGWTHRKQKFGSRWFSRKTNEQPQGFWISGGAWDFGCDTRIASQ